MTRFSVHEQITRLVCVEGWSAIAWWSGLRAWLPYRIGWAYVTGAGQIACGLGVLFSIFPCVAARAEAGMISLFTLLVWGPAILDAPTTRTPWTAFFISWAIASAAWAVAQNIAPKRPAKQNV
jgi:hypothetical protein